jgi:hypothetical protein
MLLDAENEAAVPEMCERVAERAPKKIVPIVAGVFAVGLFVIDEETQEEIVMDPLDEIVELLEAIDEETDEEAEEVTGEKEEKEESNVCGDESDYDGETIVCSLPPHEDGEHEGQSSGGDSLTW